MTAAELPAVAIVLVNYNGWRETIECLDTLLVQDYPRFHVFVVDNQSADGSVEAIARWCAQPRREPGWREFAGVRRYTAAAAPAPVPQRRATARDGALPEAAAGCLLTVVEAGANRGFAAGCNVGMAAAGERYDFYWLLNTDVVVAAGALRALVERARADPGLGIVGSTLRYYARPDVIQARAGARVSRRMLVVRHIDENRAIDARLAEPRAVEASLAYVHGASMLVARAFRAAVGPMQEDYFLYYEEFDWALRGAGRFRLGYAPDSHVFHKSGATSARTLRTFSMQLRYRNLVRFAGRFFPERLPLVRLDLVRTLLRYLLEARWRGIRVVAATLRDFDALVRSGAPAASAAADDGGPPVALRARRGG
jgi:GT2 family glycosyltransferase